MLLKVVNFLCRRAQCSKSNNELLNYSSWNLNQIFEFPMKIWSIDYAVSDKKCSSLKLHKSCNSELEYLTMNEVFTYAKATIAKHENNS